MIVYPRESAAEFMCVAACLNMVLARRGLPRFPQDVIARDLGLAVPPSLATRYPWARVSEQEEDWGVHPQVPGTSLADFIACHSIPLDELFYSPFEIFSREYGEFLSQNLEHGNDILVGYDYAAVFTAGRHRGHVSIIAGVDARTEFVSLIDPESPTEYVGVSLRDLITGINVQRDGFWVIGSATTIQWCREHF